MIIVDDHLATHALSGDPQQRWPDDVPAITWAMHYRLLRALLDSRRTGRISRDAAPLMIERAQEPPSHLLQVLDPRPYTLKATKCAREYGLSLAFAELIGAAVHHHAQVHASSRNATDRVRTACAAERVTLTVIETPSDAPPSSG